MNSQEYEKAFSYNRKEKVSMMVLTENAMTGNVSAATYIVIGAAAAVIIIAAIVIGVISKKKK